MRIYSSPDVVMDEQKPCVLVVSSKHWERSRSCEIPFAFAPLPHDSLAKAHYSRSDLFSQVETAKPLRSDGSADGSPPRSIHSIERNVSG
jgi:hypothetical protein